MSKVGIEYLRFYNRIRGRINKKGNLVPFKSEENKKGGKRWKIALRFKDDQRKMQGSFLMI